MRCQNIIFNNLKHTNRNQDLLHTMSIILPGADPGFQVRGGAHLKKIAPSGAWREHL